MLTAVRVMAAQVIGHFWAKTQIIHLWHEGLMTWVQCQLGFVGTSVTTKRHLSRFFVNNSFLINWEHVTCLSWATAVSCMGWEVKIDMSGQSNDCLWVCNVKMKKNFTGQKWGIFPRIFGFWGCSIKRFESFLMGSQVTISITCRHILANIN